jgi:hypothetical protein
MRKRVQISTGALHNYVEAVEQSFGSDMDYGRSLKFTSMIPRSIQSASTVRRHLLLLCVGQLAGLLRWNWYQRATRAPDRNHAAPREAAFPSDAGFQQEV